MKVFFRFENCYPRIFWFRNLMVTFLVFFFFNKIQKKKKLFWVNNFGENFFGRDKKRNPAIAVSFTFIPHAKDRIFFNDFNAEQTTKLNYHG